MGWFILSQAFLFLLSFVRILRLPERDKVIEILILRQQLDILLRQQDQPMRPNRAQKMLLAVLAARLKDVTDKPCAGYFAHPFEYLVNGGVKRVKIGYHAGQS